MIKLLLLSASIYITILQILGVFILSYVLFSSQRYKPFVRFIKYILIFLILSLISLLGVLLVFA